jgi:hypothetical protein
MSASPQFRENPDRAIFLTGVIDQQFVDAVTPNILKLRYKNLEPITVYIDSPGGTVTLAENLLDLLKAKDADGKSCAVITVVTGEASSAAADFLSAGNYAIAYPKARIHFHGSRQGLKRDLTMEAAVLTARFLREFNERQAIRLANDIVARCMFIYLNLRDSFDKIRASADRDMNDITCFSRALFYKLSDQADALPISARRRYERIQGLSDSVFAKVKFKKDERLSDQQKRILKEIIDYEHKSGRKKDQFWSFTEENIDRINEDFRLITDFVLGAHNAAVAPLSETYGTFFLTDAHTKYIDEGEDEADRKQRREVLINQQLRPLWYFIISLCRLLQEKENPLTARDAYWLGIVNEVLGTDLPCIRHVAENPPPTPTESASEQPQPA